MKIFTVFTALILITSSSCSAQKKIAEIPNNTVVKSKSEKFFVKKVDDKVYIENSANKLSQVKQSSPNLGTSINLSPYVKIDFDRITKICAQHISVNELETLSKIKQASLFIRIRSDITGKAIEMVFFTDATSILNIQQLDRIEAALLAEKVISVKPEISKFLAGSNFLVNDAIIFFADMLKMKTK